MQAQVEAKVNNTDIMCKSLIRCMNVAWRIDSGEEGVMQVKEGKVQLMNMEFKGKCHKCGNYGYKENKCTKKNKSVEEKGNKKFLGTKNRKKKKTRN